MNSVAAQSTTRVEFSVLKPEHVAGALHCLAESFLDEPILKTLQVPYEALSDFLRPRIELTAQDGLSVVALENGKVVSTVFCDDNHDQPVPYANESQWNDLWNPILDLLEQLHHGSEVEQAMHAEGLKFYHIFFGGTLREGRRKGYLKKLVSMALDIAREKGFDIAMAEATSPGSQHTCRQLGFIQPYALNYGDIPALTALEGERLELHLLRL
jgi:hypothetical protein